MSSWRAVYAPRNTPKPIVQRLNTEIRKALKLPEVTDKLAGMGMEVVGGTPEESAALMALEIPRWGELVKKSGASANRQRLASGDLAPRPGACRAAHPPTGADAVSACCQTANHCTCLAALCLHRGHRRSSCPSVSNSALEQG